MKRNIEIQPDSILVMIKVWDGFVRFFHWSLVGSFTALYITAHTGMQNAHILLGYFLIALIVSRIIWGFVGSKHARFRDFAYRPRQVLGYLRSIFKGQPQHYSGHNPAGAFMVFTILAALFGLGISGLVLEAGIEFEGPLLTLLYGMGDRSVYVWEEIHHLIGNTMLFLIALHLLGVISASIQHRENLIQAMITGYKPKYNKEPIHD